MAKTKKKIPVKKMKRVFTKREEYCGSDVKNTEQRKNSQEQEKESPHFCKDETLRKLFEDISWKALLYGTRPCAKKSIYILLKNHLIQMRNNYKHCHISRDEYGRQSWIKRMGTSNTKLTDYVIDDIMELLFSHMKKRVAFFLSTWIPNYVVPMYSLFSRIPREYWEYNATQRFTKTSCESSNRSDLKSIMEGFNPEYCHVDRILRIHAGKIRTLIQKNITHGGECILVLPMCLKDHFWLYIIDVKNRIIEYYNSLPHYLYKNTGRVKDKALNSMKISSFDEHMHYISHSSYLPHCEGIGSWKMAEAYDHICKKSQNQITYYKSRADLTTINLSLLWFFKNYLDMDMKMLDYSQNTPKQSNDTDCGVFVCMYSYLRIVIGVHYRHLVTRIDQRHVESFRKFLTCIISDECEFVKK